MCQNTCICQSDEEKVADAFIDIFEEVFTITEEAELYRELGLGTEPQ